MRKLRAGLALVALVATICTSSASAADLTTPPGITATQPAVRGAVMHTPVHPSVPLIRRFFPIPALGGYTSLLAYMQIEQTDLTRGIFYANQFNFVDGDGGYIGLQTRLTGVGGAISPGAIFSIFNATGAKAGAGGIVVTDIEVGKTFYSIHLPYKWVLGHIYKFNVIVVGTERQATLLDTTTGATIIIGSISVPPTWQGLDSEVMQWTEVYSPISFLQCSDIPLSKVLFMGNISVMGIVPTSSESSIFTADTVCNNSAVQDLGGVNADITYREIVGATS
jgi:hypothetical protein